MFRRINFAAAVSGLIAGLFLSAAQALRVIPLILEAETYEKASPPARALPAGTPALGDEAGIDFSRTALTAVSNVISAIGFALLLVAGFSLRGGSDWRSGILWGLGGFAAFSLAPEAMMHAFVLAALATSLIFWIVLGTLAGYFFHRFEQV